jgi:hypothetical protein
MEEGILQAALLAVQTLNNLLPLLSSSNQEQVKAALAALDKQADDLHGEAVAIERGDA